MNKTQYKRITRSLVALGTQLTRIELETVATNRPLQWTKSLYTSFINKLYFLEKKYHIYFINKGKIGDKCFKDFDEIEKNENFEFWWIELLEIEKKYTKKMLDFRRYEMKLFIEPTYYSRDKK